MLLADDAVKPLARGETGTPSRVPLSARGSGVGNGALPLSAIRLGAPVWQQVCLHFAGVLILITLVCKLDDSAVCEQPPP